MRFITLITTLFALPLLAQEPLPKVKPEVFDVSDHKAVLYAAPKPAEGKPTEALTPAVQGVIVIAEGGNDPKVKQSITEAVTVLTGVSPHNVGVFPKRK